MWQADGCGDSRLSGNEHDTIHISPIISLVVTIGQIEKELEQGRAGIVLCATNIPDILGALEVCVATKVLMRSP